MSTVMVVGAGLMGSGIAQVSAVAGHEVILRDITDEAVAKGRGAIEASLTRFAEKGAISAEDAEAALARITGTTDLDGAVGADIIVEAIIEEVDLKAALFADLDRLAPAGAVLATNTSAIPITRIAAATQRPEAVVGTHFFSPVPMMKLCELVRGLKTSDETLAAARTWAEGIGKTCIVVNRDVAGFVTTRIITALVNEAIRLVETGVASPEDVDIACKLGFGHAMGPLATADLKGIDVMRRASMSIYNETADPSFYPPELITRMAIAGDLGRKSGRGFYTYGG
ncbi:MAG TPA: 3-hydroxyacyl-CoA dehydrogenase NAD-binding domain-containing protein [Candidatus Limnocylindrales bacterium]|nr:3-hydroxyacyl-CoA dehydrogenase NAD-binding domain-containing protein [Candidatus Limnocylindrales bacterium]